MNAQAPVMSVPSLDMNLLSTISRPTDGSAEAIRALRTHVMARHVGLGHRALAVCAPSVNVGCTFVSANLAVSLSQIGISTLLIDGNMRAPGMDRIFRLPKPRNGLQQCLASPDGGQSDYGEFIEPEFLPNLSIMFSGGIASNAQELLASDRFKMMMDACLRDFDATIIDTPPANSCSDVSRICNVVSYCLIVARRDKTYVNDVKLLAGQLKADHAQVIGTVLNDN